MKKGLMQAILFPPVCPLCERVLSMSQEGEACDDCGAKLDYYRGASCMKCGRSLKDDTAEYCEGCLKRSFHFDRAVSAYVYEKEARELILKFKYHTRKDLGLFFAHMTLKKHERLLREFEAGAIVPIPIHRSRYKKRGYNQAEVYGRHLADELKVPCLNLLSRTKETGAQKKLDTGGRLANIMNAFSIDKEKTAALVRGGLKKVIITDDILTTGATVECASVLLKDCGIEEILVVTISSV